MKLYGGKSVKKRNGRERPGQEIGRKKIKISRKGVCV